MSTVSVITLGCFLLRISRCHNRPLLQLSLVSPMTADTSVYFVRWQQDEQIVAGWVMPFSICGLCTDDGASGVLTHCRAFLSWAMMNHASL